MLPIGGPVSDNFVQVFLDIGFQSLADVRFVFHRTKHLDIIRNLFTDSAQITECHGWMFHQVYLVGVP